ncbi:MAG: transcription termination/antitermination NusG family protein [Planctomycetota bacterium]
MPILKKEDDIYPLDLLVADNEFVDQDSQKSWWCIYTISRREKELARQLTKLRIAHYCPTIEKRYRSPKGRIRTSFIPLFANYLFFYGSNEDRFEAMKSNCISKYYPIEDPDQLVGDLRKIKTMVESGVPLTPESRLESGDRVRVKTGPFAKYEGTVIRRDGKTRLLIAIEFLEQGVSMEIDEGLLAVV